MSQEMLQRLKRSVKFRLYNPTRYWVDRVALAAEVRSRTNSRRLIRGLLISDDQSATSEMQFSPFRAYRRRLRSRFNFAYIHLLVDDALHITHLLPKAKLFWGSFDVIFLKFFFRTAPEKVQCVVRELHAAQGGARIVYYDGDDDACIQWPEMFPYIDLYVKKHVFRDFSTYEKQFIGKTNLTDYVAREFGASFEMDQITRSKPLAPAHFDKLFLGYNLALDSKITELYTQKLLHERSGSRAYDVVCRASVDPQSWLYHLRKGVAPNLEALSPRWRVLTPTRRVPQDAYYDEMLSSRICISPFGYGEICWRDFEAILCGCLLVKPDMDHIRTEPDIFRPYQTYVPVKWDFRDLQEKCTYYLEHEEERRRIAKRAYDVLSDYYRKDRFLDRFQEMMERLGLLSHDLEVKA